jgi:hypothetical protein
MSLTHQSSTSNYISFLRTRKFGQNQEFGYFDNKPDNLPYPKGAPREPLKNQKPIKTKAAKGVRIANIQHRQNVICKSADGNGDKSMSLRALRQFLEENGMFPDKYRSTIWRHLLNLPDNAVSFNDYVRMGTHKNFLDFPEKFPLASDALCSRMVRMLSVFAHYSPVFGDTTFTPICTIFFP